jgi:hypothetical protein
LQFSVLDLELGRDRGSLRFAGFEPALQGSRRVFIAAANAASSPPSAQAETPAAPKNPMAATSSVNGTALDAIVSLLPRDMVRKASCWSFKAVLTGVSGALAAERRRSPVVARERRRRGHRGGLLKQC